MKRTAYVFLFLFFIACSSFLLAGDQNTRSMFTAFTMYLCKTGCGNEVFSGDLYQGSTKIGNVIALNRTSKKVKAKYFAYKDNGTVVHDRYDSWRSGKNIVLVSSGAYATGFNGTDLPVGLTIDNGNKVNDRLDLTMDGLIIVEAVGGVRATNIKDGDLTIRKGGVDKVVNIKNDLQRAEFLNWAKDEQATVFQTHLLIFKDQLKFTQSNSKVAERKILALTKDRSGNVIHFIVYCKNQQLTLYEMAYNTLQMLNAAGYEVIAAANLDTGSMDVLSTSTELPDCANAAIEGKSNSDRKSMTNMLAYYYE